MIEKLKEEFTEIYFTNISSTKGLEMLSQNIGISKNSMRRFLGKLNDGTKLRTSTLNLIAEKLGYRNYQDFCENYNNISLTIDFKTLETFYNSVKGKGVVLGEERFQNVNYGFSEKIILDSNNLKEFIKRFSTNHEALEYVLAWHPTYSRINNEDYQESLLKVAKITNNSHLKVFSYSFIFFGKFLADSFENDEKEFYLKYIGRSIKHMRKNYHFFWSFPEVRYAVVKCLYSKSFPDEIKEICTKSLSLSDRFIYNLYLSDALNLVKNYEAAEILQNTILDKKNIEEFERENFHHKTHLPLLKIVRAITLFHLDRKEESLRIFRQLLSFIDVIPFDIKEYFELQYYYLGTKFFPESIDFKSKFDLIVEKTKFIYFKGL